MRQVIINADDFGLSDGICDAILELISARAISSTSLMLAADGAADRCRTRNAHKLAGRTGVHLQLTGGSPILPSNQVPTLIDHETGRFLPKNSLARVDPEDAAREWRAQIILAHDILGGRPSHLDSHHGVQHLRGLDEVFIKLALEFDLPVRDRSAMQKPRSAEALRGSDVVLYEWTAKGLDSLHLQHQLSNAIDRSPEAAIIEVVTHPGHSDDTLRRISSLNDLREQDRRSLLTLAASDWFETAGIRLISFSDVL